MRMRVKGTSLHETLINAVPPSTSTARRKSFYSAFVSLDDGLILSFSDDGLLL